MDEPRDFRIKESQTEKDKYHITFMWNLKKNHTNELIYKTETDSQMLNTNLWLPRGKGWSGGYIRSLGFLLTGLISVGGEVPIWLFEGWI